MPPDTKALWDALSQEIDKHTPETSGPPAVEALSQQPTVGDRLTSRLLGGTWFLLLVGGVTLCFLGFAGHKASLVLSPLLLLLGAWITAPLVSFGSGLSPFRAIAWAWPFAGLTCFLVVLPIALERSFLANRGEVLGQFARDLQWALEAAFSPGAGFVILLFAAFLGLFIRSLKFRHPWARPVSPARYRLHLAYLAVACASLLLFCLALLWRAPAASKLASPASSPVWDQLFAEYNLVGLETTRAQRQAGYAALESRTIDALQHQFPTLQRDLRMASDAVERQWGPEGVGSAPSREKYLFYRLKLDLQIRPRYQYSRTMGLLEDAILPRLLKPDLSAHEIEGWRSKLEELKSSLAPDRMSEIETNAAQYFDQSKNSEVVVFGVLDPETPRRSRVELKARDGQLAANAEPTPMKILGATVPLSPTVLLSHYEGNRKREQWEFLRSSIDELSPEELDRSLNAARKRFGSRIDYLDQAFFDEIAGRRYSDTVGPWIDYCLLVLELRQIKLNQGRYPESLSAGDSIRYLWQPKEQRLTDATLLSPAFGRSVSRRLP